MVAALVEAVASVVAVEAVGTQVVEAVADMAAVVVATAKAVVAGVTVSIIPISDGLALTPCR